MNDLIEMTKSRRNLVKADFEIALNLAKRLDFFFEKGTFAERRLLCETVFKRLYIEEGKISKPELNSPFGLIASVAGGSGCVQLGGPFGTVPELMFEKKGLIPALQQLLTASL